MFNILGKNLLKYRNHAQYLIVIVWILGLLLGTFAAHNLVDVYTAMIANFHLFNSSIYCFSFAVFLPLISSLVVLFLGRPNLLIPIAFTKGFLFSNVSSVVYLIFGNCGWLMRWLFLFTDSCLIPALILFWIYHISGNREHLLRNSVILSFYALCIASIDYTYVSNLLHLLYNF